MDLEDLIEKLDMLRKIRKSFTIVDLRVLLEVANKGFCSVGELARDTKMPQGSLSTIIFRLVDLNLVGREEDENNRSKVRLSLTKEGEELVKKILE